MQRTWADVHTMLIGYIRDALAVELPEGLIARAEAGVSLAEWLGSTGHRTADVAVVEPEPWKRGQRPKPTSFSGAAARSKPSLKRWTQWFYAWKESLSDAELAEDLVENFFDIGFPNHIANPLQRRAQFDRGKLRRLAGAQCFGGG